MNIEIEKPAVLLFSNKQGGRYYFHGNLQSSDVLPIPVQLSGLKDDEGDGKFFLFWIADCFSPCMYVVRGQSFEEAYEDFVDWQTDQLKIDDADIPKDEEKQQEFLENCNYNSTGTPVDTEAVKGEEVDLLAVIAKGDDQNLWNVACMLLMQVTRYENKYQSKDFINSMAKCVGGDMTRALDAFHKAEDVSFHQF